MDEPYSSAVVGALVLVSFGFVMGVVACALAILAFEQLLNKVAG